MPPPLTPSPRLGAPYVCKSMLHACRGGLESPARLRYAARKGRLAISPQLAHLRLPLQLQYLRACLRTQVQQGRQRRHGMHGGGGGVAVAGPTRVPLHLTSSVAFNTVNQRPLRTFRSFASSRDESLGGRRCSVVPRWAAVWWAASGAAIGAASTGQECSQSSSNQPELSGRAS